MCNGTRVALLLFAVAMHDGLRVENLVGHVPGPFSLHVPHGGCACIMGASGAGKSSLLRMIADLDPSRGRVSLDGESRTSMSAPAWRQRVMYVPSDAGWWCDVVADHFLDVTRIGPSMAALSLDERLLEASPTRLSSGERQRFALLRAIERKPAFLLLDEPTSALDAATTAQVESLLREVRATGVGLAVVSHSREQALRLDATHYRLTHSGIARVDAP